MCRAAHLCALLALVSWYAAPRLCAQDVPPSLLPTPVLPQTIIPYEFPSARFTSLGGFHAALGDDFYALFSNPALFADMEKQVSVGELSFSIIEFDILTLLYAEGQQLRDTFLQLGREGIEISMELGGPFAFGMVKENFGWGVFNASRMHITWDSSTIYYLHFRLSEELLFAGAWGYRVLDFGDYTLDAGISLKTFVRGTYLPIIWLDKIKYFFENINYDYFESQIGIGSTMGLRFTLFNALSAGLAFHDPYSPVYVAQYKTIERFYAQQMVEGAIIPLTPRLALGLAYRMPYPFGRGIITNFKLAADIRQLLPALDPNYRGFWFEFNAGVELEVLEVLAVRLGISDMLPAGGLGIDLTIFQIDAVFFMKELGAEIGDYTAFAAMLSINYRY
jgi:hypothetical protein